LTRSHELYVLVLQHVLQTNIRSIAKSVMKHLLARQWNLVFWTSSDRVWELWIVALIVDSITLLECWCCQKRICGCNRSCFPGFVYGPICTFVLWWAVQTPIHNKFQSLEPIIILKMWLEGPLTRWTSFFIRDRFSATVSEVSTFQWFQHALSNAQLHETTYNIKTNKQLVWKSSSCSP
jgi:hypothetical protein